MIHGLVKQNIFHKPISQQANNRRVNRSMCMDQITYNKAYKYICICGSTYIYIINYIHVYRYMKFIL